MSPEPLNEPSCGWRSNWPSGPRSSSEMTKKLTASSSRIASNWRSQPSMPLRFWLMSLNGSLCRLSMTTTA